MSDVVIEFRNELFYGDIIQASVAAGDFSKIGFELFYNSKRRKKIRVVVLAKTAMVCYDYELRKL